MSYHSLFIRMAKIETKEQNRSQQMLAKIGSNWQRQGKANGWGMESDNKPTGQKWDEPEDNDMGILLQESAELRADQSFMRFGKYWWDVY